MIGTVAISLLLPDAAQTNTPPRSIFPPTPSLSQSEPPLTSRHAIFLSCLALPCLYGISLINARQTEKKAEDAVLAFKGATIHTAAGPKIDGGVLVVHKGKVVAVGDAETAIPRGAKVIDAAGKTIVPGLVDSHSHVAIFGRPGVTANADGNEGSGPVQPGLRALDAINPDDVSVRMA